MHHHRRGLRIPIDTPNRPARTLYHPPGQKTRRKSMKIHVKLPGGGEINIQKEPSDGFWLLPVFGVLSLVGLFWLMWVLR